MSGIDEQHLICPACGDSSYFTFRLKSGATSHNIWHLDKKAMKKFGYSRPVIFSRGLMPKSKWKKFIDMIEAVKCNACHNEEVFNSQTRKMVNLLKHIFDKRGGLVA